MVTRNRFSGHGCRMRGNGKYRSAIFFILIHVSRRLPLRRISAPCHRGWPPLLWTGDSRSLPSRSVVCGSRPQGRETSRPTCAGTDQVRAGDQPQDRERARPDSAAHAARPRRRGDRMKRRQFMSLVGGAAAWPIAALGQQRRHVGVLMGTTGDAQGQALIGGFRAALETLGRRDVDLDVRWSGANIDRIRADATDLANAKPDVIMVYSVRVLNAARQSTGHIPVVFIATSDPVGLGLVESLARPGGNLTGFMVYEVSLAGKLVEILKETAPQVARVGLVFNPENLSA